MNTRLVFLLMLLAFGLHVALGEVDIAWGELLGALLTGGEVNELHATIVKEGEGAPGHDGHGVRHLVGMAGLAHADVVSQSTCRSGVLGITSRGSLGVALAVMLGLAVTGVDGGGSQVFCGAAVDWRRARRFVSPVTTLVFGLMISYAVSAVVSVLQSSATAEALQTFVFWGMGTFGKSQLVAGDVLHGAGVVGHMDDATGQMVGHVDPWKVWPKP